MMKINSSALFGIIKFLRIRILITCYTIAFIGSAATGTINVKTALIILVLGVWYLHTATANDYADRYIDKINLKNARDRPLITKDISYKQLWTIHYTAGALALLISYYYGSRAVVLTAGILLLDYAYSFKPIRVSDRGLLSQLLLPIAYVYYPFTLGVWASHPEHGYPWLLSIGLYFGFVSRLLLKDFRDVKGDKKFGKNTFLLRHGAKNTSLVSGISSLLALSLILVEINFSPGAMVVLAAVQIQAVTILYQLSRAKGIDQQVYYVKWLANLANISVLTILIFYLMLNQLTASTRLVYIVPALTGFSLMLLNYLKYHRKNVVMPSLLQHFAWIPLRLFMKFFCSLKIQDQANINDLKGNAIIASNHSSELDPLFIVAALPFFSSKLPLYFVSREKSFYKNSRLKFLYGGTFFRMMGAYPAYVGLNNYKQALMHHLEAAGLGRSVCIFPIGRKHTINEVSSAKGGVSYLAQTTGAPIVPVLIKGLGRYKFIDYLKGECKLTITFGKPLYAKDIFIKPTKTNVTMKQNENEKAAVVLMEQIARL